MAGRLNPIGSCSQCIVHSRLPGNSGNKGEAEVKRGVSYAEVQSVLRNHKSRQADAMPDPAKYGVFHYPLTATAVTPQSRLELSESASCHVWSVGLTRGVIPSHPFTQPCDPSVVVLPSDCWGCQSHCVTRWLE